MKILIIGRLLTFFIPFIFILNYVLNIYYSNLNSVCDVGWFTYLITNSTSLPIENPIKGVFDKTYLSTHFSLFYYPLSLLYQIVKDFVSPPLYFSMFIASSYSIISLSILLAGEELLKNKSILWYILLIIISILTPFNGVGLGLIGFPHIEIAIPAFILLFFTLYFKGYKYSSYFTFLFLLTIREDAGFHIFSILSILLIIFYFIKRIPKDLIIIASISLIYSIIVIMIQKHFFIGDNALERIYLGSPHFAHINYDFLLNRVEFFIHNREYIYVPMLLLIPLSIWSRNIFLIIPIISTFPWVILSFIAINSMPNSFSNYYAFPFIVPLSWSMISFLILHKIDQNRISYYKTFITTLIITLSSILLFSGNNGNVDDSPWKNFDFQYIKTIKSTDKIIKTIDNNKILFGNILYDEAISALSIKSLKKEEYGYLNDFSPESIKNANTLIFYKKSKKLFKIIEKKPTIKYIYKFKDNDIIIASEHNLSSIF